MDRREGEAPAEPAPEPSGRGAAGRLLGLTVDTVDPRKPGSAVLYGLDVVTGEVLFRKTLPSVLTSDGYWPH